MQAEEIEFVEKEDYDSASAIATDLLYLETNTPEKIQKMLQEQGPHDVILGACDELVANVVRGYKRVCLRGPTSSELVDLERAYKRMRFGIS